MALVTINYESYENKKQNDLVKTFYRIKDKRDECKANLETYSKLLEFLKGKIETNLENDLADFVPYEESESYKMHLEAVSKMSEAEYDSLVAEVMAEVNRPDTPEEAQEGE